MVRKGERDAKERLKREKVYPEKGNSDGIAPGKQIQY